MRALFAILMLTTCASAQTVQLPSGDWFSTSTVHGLDRWIEADSGGITVSIPDHNPVRFDWVAPIYVSDGATFKVYEAPPGVPWSYTYELCIGQGIQDEGVIW